MAELDDGGVVRFSGPVRDTSADSSPSWLPRNMHIASLGTQHPRCGSARGGLPLPAACARRAAVRRYTWPPPISTAPGPPSGFAPRPCSANIRLPSGASPIPASMTAPRSPNAYTPPFRAGLFSMASKVAGNALDLVGRPHPALRGERAMVWRSVSLSASLHYTLSVRSALRRLP